MGWVGNKFWWKNQIFKATFSKKVGAKKQRAYGG